MKRFLVGLFAFLASVGVASAQIVVPNISISPIITASSGAVGNAVSTATLTAPNAGYWEITQVEVTGTSTSGGAAVSCTITGIDGGTMTIPITIGVPSTTTLQPAPPQVVIFNGGLASLPQTAVVFSCPAFGAGANIAANIHGMIVH